ncbi:glycosyltransferase family 2 protein [Neomoorella thermoacetica]|uniref:glycosyltransferase family 2 protein n=1 Tax=Neomoorella thermoacetica TaxID=1525 RepID=UPI0008FA602E|nr:glycosyltransferase family 2 protein [Moorella thermoacetica]APC09037.1 N-glycosyltransferase [Moorella thermoacetica]OIQ12437.1 N-glycosyltransferase [Moorella thermoacetica]OIQ55014.1 N-glycosyltransferase [Moorella thermoacetica]
MDWETISPAQILYLITVGFYLLFFGLFLRYFYWKWYAVKYHWRKRLPLDAEKVKALAAAKGLDIPFFTIMVPARNESEVIANTIEHLASLNYPNDRYEILVITDEKEALARAEGQGEGPTTMEVVEAKIREFAARPGMPQLKHCTVPYDFDGRFRGSRRGHSIPSTKGRALNYGLEFVDPRTTICGFYDAESHPEADVLLYIAWSWLHDPRERIWQGPVFQVRNFYQLGIITKIAAIYQAISHEIYLPILMKKLPFVGGTNLFVGRRLLERIGGYDHRALTEDLELGVRAFLETGVWAEYFPYFSTEQTPATLYAFFRQRLRWGSGHLQVCDKFRYAYQYSWDKRGPLLHNLFWKGQGEWLLYQAAVLVPLSIVILGLNGGLDPSIVPFKIRVVLHYLVFIYFAFTFYAYGHFHRLMAPVNWWQQFIGFLQLLALPFASFFLPLPYTAASIMKALNRQPQTWVKTPRTKEATR